MNATLTASAIEEVKNLIKAGNGKEAAEMMELMDPLEGAELEEFSEFLQEHCQEDLHKALPVGITAEKLEEAGVRVVTLDQRNQNSYFAEKVKHGMSAIRLSMKDLERIARNPEAAAAQEMNGTIWINQTGGPLFSETARPYRVGFAGKIRVFWALEETSLSEGTLEDVLVEVSTHALENPVTTGVHFTMRMSLDIGSDGSILDARLFNRPGRDKTNPTPGYCTCRKR